MKKALLPLAIMASLACGPAPQQTTSTCPSGSRVELGAAEHRAPLPNGQRSEVSPLEERLHQYTLPGGRHFYQIPAKQGAPYLVGLSESETKKGTITIYGTKLDDSDLLGYCRLDSDREKAIAYGTVRGLTSGNYEIDIK